MLSLRERLMRCGTLAVVAAVPLLYFGPSWYSPYATSKTFIFYGITELLAALWVYTVLVDRSYRLSRRAILLFLPIVLYTLWMTVAGIAAQNPELAFWSSLERGTGLITLYHTLALSLVVASIAQRDGIAYIERLFKWFVGGSLAVALSAWLGNEGLQLPIEVLRKSKGGGLIGNSSLAGAYLLFACFFTLWLIADAWRKGKGKIALIGAALGIIFSPVFVGVLFGQGIIGSARGALIGLIIGIIVCGIWLLIGARRRPVRIAGIALAALAFVGCCIGWQALLSPSSALHARFVDQATDTRFIFWDVAKRSIAQRPVLGWGPENFSIAYQKNFDPRIFLSSTTAEVWNDRAHNVLYETATASGIPGLILYIASLGSLLYGIALLQRKDMLASVQAGLLAGLVIGYTAQNLFVFDSLLSLIALYALYGAVFGLAASSSANKRPQARPLPLTAAGIGIAAIVCFIFFVLLPIRKVTAIARVVTLPLNKRPDHYQDLLRGSPVGNAREVSGIAADTAALYSANQSRLQANQQLLPYAVQDIRQATAYFESVIKKEPADYRMLLSVARLSNTYAVLADRGNDRELKAHVLALESAARALSPEDPQVYVTTAQTYLTFGDREHAAQYLEMAIDRAPYLAWTHQALLDFARATKNQSLYQSALERAKKDIPNF